MKKKFLTIILGVGNICILSNVVSAATLPAIYHYDIRDLSKYTAEKRYDIRHTVACVQGIVNRDAPRIFVSYHNDDLTWLNRLQESGGLCEGWNLRKVRSIEEYIRLFQKYIKGVILYDPNPNTGVMATSLVATTVAGVKRGVAVRKDTSPGSIYNYLVNAPNGPKLPVLVDLTGKFTGTGTIWQTSTPSTGSAKCDAYIWAKEKYIDTGKCNPTRLACTLDLHGLNLPGNAELRAQLSNLDYVVKNKGFCFELSPWGDEYPSDDPGQPLGTDLDTFKKILDACNRQTNKTKMIKFCGFVNWDQKYTAHVGGSHAPVPSEDEMIYILSAYNVYSEADAVEPTNISNASFYEGANKAMQDRRYVQNPPPTYNEMVSKGLIDADGNVVPGNYIMIYLGDYDQASWLLYEAAGKKYVDSSRGKVPCNWAFTPNSSDRVGVAFDYVYRNKSDKDYFVGGTSGAGYVNPSQLHGARAPSGYPSGTGLWQNHSRKYYRKFDYSISPWLLNGTNFGRQDNLTVTDVRTYLPFSGDGVGLQPSGQTSDQWLENNIPVKERYGPDNPNSLADVINYSSGVNFAWYRTILYTPSQVKVLMDDCADSGNNHRFLDAYTFYYLLRHHLGGSNNYRVTWVSDTIPRIMAAGKKYPVTVTVRNDGWDTWSGKSGYSLRYAIVSHDTELTKNDYSSNRIFVPGSVTVKSGESVTFSFTITAPKTNGNYDFYYDMFKTGKSFCEFNNIEWKNDIIVATSETDIDTDGDSIPDVVEEQNGTLYWHRFSPMATEIYMDDQQKATNGP